MAPVTATVWPSRWPGSAGVVPASLLTGWPYPVRPRPRRPAAVHGRRPSPPPAPRPSGVEGPPPGDGQRQPAGLRRRPPGAGDLAVDEHRAGPAQHRPEILHRPVGHQQLAVPDLQVGVEGGEQAGGAGALRRERAGQHPAPLAVDVDRFGVLGPARPHLRHRGVDEGRDLLRGGRAGQPQVGPDDVQPLGRRPGGQDTGLLQDGGRGTRPQHQPGAQRGQPEGLLVGVHGVAGPAEPEVGLGQPVAQRGRHVALDRRPAGDGAHLRPDVLERLQHRDACRPQRFGAVEDARGGVGLRPGPGGGGDAGQVGAAVGVRGAAQRPGGDQVGVRGVGQAPDGQRPAGRPGRAGVLHAEVEDGGVGHRAAGVAVQLLGPDPVREDVVPGPGGHPRTCPATSSASRSPAVSGTQCVTPGSTSRR